MTQRNKNSLVGTGFAITGGFNLVHEYYGDTLCGGLYFSCEYQFYRWLIAFLVLTPFMLGKSLA